MDQSEIEAAARESELA